MTIRALSWNLFHGRDFPPDPALFGWRSRLLRVTARNATHVQLNRELLGEFAVVLAGADWNLALLQECPPRWWRPLADRCEAEAHGVLTSRNSLTALRSLLARLNPDLIASNEGGSNLTLVRGAGIVERRKLELRPGPRPERRVMAFTAIAGSGGDQVCVANLHLSAGAKRRELAEAELVTAAERATAWAAGRPLLLGGDLNLRPRDTRAYRELERRFGLRAPTGPDVLDHLLARDMQAIVGPAVWEPERRELPAGDLTLRLSDHAPVEAAFESEVSPQPAAG